MKARWAQESSKCQWVCLPEAVLARGWPGGSWRGRRPRRPGTTRSKSRSWLRLRSCTCRSTCSGRLGKAGSLQPTGYCTRSQTNCWSHLADWWSPRWRMEPMGKYARPGYSGRVHSEASRDHGVEAQSSCLSRSPRHCTWRKAATFSWISLRTRSKSARSTVADHQEEQPWPSPDHS